MKNYLSTNTKLKRDSILSFGIPAYKSASGKLTCPGAKDCIVGCYAKNGLYLMPSVKKAQEERLALTLKSAEFHQTIDSEIKRRKPAIVRIHDSGDFYSTKYFSLWCMIAIRNPDVKFYAYTKMIAMIRQYQAIGGTIPSNLTLIYSFGGKFDAMIDPSKDRHSAVFESDQAMRSAGYADVTHRDIYAMGKNHRIGLVYHGPKAKAWQAEAVSA